MVLELIVTKTDDGVNAEVPSINGCETWAHDEDTAIDNAVELVMYYLNLADKKSIRIDKARGQFKKKVYKLIFDK